MEDHTMMTSVDPDVQIPSSSVTRPGGGDGKGNAPIPLIAIHRGLTVRILPHTARRNCGAGYVTVEFERDRSATLSVTDLQMVEGGPTTHQMSQLFRQATQAKKVGSVAEVEDFRAYSVEMARVVIVKPSTVKQVEGGGIYTVEVVYTIPATIEVAWAELEAAPGGPNKAQIVNTLRVRVGRRNDRPGESLRSPDHRTPFRGAENATEPVM